MGGRAGAPSATAGCPPRSGPCATDPNQHPCRDLLLTLSLWSLSSFCARHSLADLASAKRANTRRHSKVRLPCTVETPA
eukprot:387577-Prorocentrum_minimum.AAC.1